MTEKKRTEAQKRADRKYAEKKDDKAIIFHFGVKEAERIENKIMRTGLSKAEFLRRAAEDAETEFDSLQDLTRQESGIVIFESGDTIIGNWAGINGIPRVTPWGVGLMGLNETITLDKTVKVVKNVSLYVDKSRVIYDANDDAKILHKYSGSVYYLTGEIVVIAPNGWN